jgi:cell division protein FtsL
MNLRALTVLLIALILAQLGGVWMVYSTALVIHKQNKEHRLADQSKWQTFELSPEAIKLQLVKDDEIIIDGQLYDIVQISYQPTVVHVVATPDKAENKLKNSLSRLQSECGGWSDIANRVQTFAATSYIPAQINCFCAIKQFEPSLAHHARYSFGISQLPVKTIHHPPIHC